MGAVARKLNNPRLATLATVQFVHKDSATKLSWCIWIHCRWDIVRRRRRGSTTVREKVHNRTILSGRNGWKPAKIALHLCRLVLLRSSLFCQEILVLVSPV